jgi:transcription termination factor Rho
LDNELARTTQARRLYNAMDILWRRSYNDSCIIMADMIKKLWNILTGKDLNGDGKVDIKDDLIRAEKKAQYTYTPTKDNNE